MPCSARRWRGGRAPTTRSCWRRCFTTSVTWRRGRPRAPPVITATQGAGLLRPCVPARVAWLIEHHVVAKCYLCSVDPRYAERLSPASVRSLVAQGAALDVEERLALETRPWFADAVRIRRWDDEAKIVGAVCPPLAAYRPLIERWLGPQSWPAAAGIA